jgi:hypothetical protein
MSEVSRAAASLDTSRSVMADDHNAERAVFITADRCLAPERET